MTSDIQEDSSIKFEPMIKPCFPKATEILFFTGNTLTLFPLLKKSQFDSNRRDYWLYVDDVTNIEKRK